MKKIKIAYRNRVPDVRSLVQPLFKLGVKKTTLGEFFSLPQNNKLIPHFELG
jgi:hypothetical protein